EHEEKYAFLERELAQAAEAHAGELVALEARLAERGHRIAELERELARREVITQGLIAELEPEVRGSPRPTFDPEASQLAETAPVQIAFTELNVGHGEPRTSDTPETAAAVNAVAHEAEWVAKLDAMAIDAARREGELHARAWRIAELEGELTRADYRAADAERLARAEDELDILRRALAQEHDARRRIESGEELEKARAELQRQAVLLEQLARELDARDRAQRVQDVTSP
ncbi:MAG TPA: hypothetical protein VNO21_01185, partial [Polyangiaceae bacterium]|nr:hypothetical protein [Polyangiaceae bacterium]